MIFQRVSGSIRFAGKPRLLKNARGCSSISRPVHSIRAMFPNEHASARPSYFLIVETSPETLDMLQKIEFLSFADSDDSKPAEKPVVEVESDDPFDSDDLEDLLKIVLPPNPSTLASAVPQTSTQTMKKEENAHFFAGSTVLTQVHASQLAQRPSQDKYGRRGRPYSQNRSQHEHKWKWRVKRLKYRKDEVSLGSITSDSHIGADMATPVIPNHTTADVSVKGEFRDQNSCPQSLKMVSQEPLPPSSPPRNGQFDAFKRPLSQENGHASPVKCTLLSSPQHIQSYASQMQYRLFTSSHNRQVRERQPVRHSTIQLATQQAELNVPQNNMSFSQPEEAYTERKTVKPFILSPEQNHVLELAKQGKSIFFTGSAGTGKSILLKSIIKELKQAKGPGTVAVTASTGLAACNIGGITLHSFAGIGLGKGELSALVKTVRRNRKCVNRWKETEVLIIDEISMIDGNLFHNLDRIARTIRRNYLAPFGGIQIIVCGDFYQLPPVSKAELQPDGTYKKHDASFAFDCDAWNEALDHSIVLREVFRQKGDQEFIDMLNDMRHGIVSETALAEFKRLSRPLVCPEGIVPTELYATRTEVDKANSQKLAIINGEIKHYVAKDGGSLPPAVRNQMLSNFLAPRELVLKENAQVMCIKNVDETLVNGSLGYIVKFVDRNSYMCETIRRQDPDIDLEKFEEKCKRVTQKKNSDPQSDFVFNFLAEKYLKTGQAENEVTHEGSGVKEEPSEATVKEEPSEAAVKEEPSEEVVKEDSEIKEEPSEETVRPETNVDTTQNEDYFMAIQSQNNHRKMEFIKALEETSTGERYPLVRFLCPDGVTTRDHLMEPERWEILDDKTEEVLVSRIQFPLMLAWALSIHKSQGQTLQKVRVDLSRIFENGQAYVALSRAVSRDGLQVINFREDRVRAHPAVDTFYDSLLTTEDLSKRTS